MLSLPSTKPTQFRPSSVNTTITRINSLIKNLDLKLERLCCQNFTNKADCVRNTNTGDSLLSEGFLAYARSKSKEERLQKLKTEFENVQNCNSVKKDLQSQRQLEASVKSNCGEISGDNKSIDLKSQCRSERLLLTSTEELSGNCKGNTNKSSCSKNKLVTESSSKKDSNSIIKTNLNLSTSDLSVETTSKISEVKQIVKIDPDIVKNISKIKISTRTDNNKATDIEQSIPLLKTGLAPHNKERSKEDQQLSRENLSSLDKSNFVVTTQSVCKTRETRPSNLRTILNNQRKANEFSVNEIKTLLRLRSGECGKNTNQRLSIHLVRSTKMNVTPYLQAQSKKMGEEPPNPGVVQLKTLANIYRAKVIDAYRNRQIFTVFGNYGTIRRALLKRGWLEKLPPSRYPKLQNLPEDVLLQHAKRGNEYETVAISKIINHFPAFFVWQPKGHRDLYADVLPYRNRIRRTRILDFSTKVGLIGCAEQQKWYLQEGVAGMLYPRFFRLGPNQEEQLAFTEDFRMTQCRSLLLYLIKSFEKPEEIIDYENGSVSSVIVHFALGRIRRQADEWGNVISLDTELTQIPDAEWNDFVVNSSKVINQQHKIKCTYRELVEFVKTSRTILARIKEKRPDYKWDGFKNLWILKPGYQSRGLGIIIRNNVDDILRWSESHSSRRYIVQKYIEQPLLIYRTKFDIRQYMLVFIRESTVQIWLYKDCYLRFSSQEYSIDDLREVIHLTNNSVQKKYKNKSTRDPHLPKSNMWSLDQFKAYLKSQSHPDDMWETRVFAGFSENLIAVVLASLDETNLCENSFELYGCDFMLDEQFNPILIEINSTPDLSPSTEITARICPMVMQDCIKVIVDLPRNSRALTGQFKLAYEVNYKFKQDLNLKDGLNVRGKSMELCRRERMASLRLKRNTKVKKNEFVNNNKKSIASEGNRKPTPSERYKKSKTSLAANIGQSLKAATKEALALRYTMPK